MSERDGPPICRVCQDGDGELIVPCDCKGSVKYVHRQCLDKWRSSGVNPMSLTRCEICKRAYEYESLVPFPTVLITLLCFLYFIAASLLITVVALAVGWAAIATANAASKKERGSAGGSEREGGSGGGHGGRGAEAEPSGEGTSSSPATHVDAFSWQVVSTGLAIVAGAFGTSAVVFAALLAYYAMLPATRVRRYEVPRGRGAGAEVGPAPRVAPVRPDRDRDRDRRERQERREGEESEGERRMLEEDSDSDRDVEGEGSEGPPSIGRAPSMESVYVEELDGWQTIRFMGFYVCLGSFVSCALSPAAAAARKGLGAIVILLCCFVGPALLLIQWAKRQVAKRYRVKDLSSSDPQNRPPGNGSEEGDVEAPQGEGSECFGGESRRSRGGGLEASDSPGASSPSPPGDGLSSSLFGVLGRGRRGEGGEQQPGSASSSGGQPLLLHDSLGILLPGDGLVMPP